MFRVTTRVRSSTASTARSSPRDAAPSCRDPGLPPATPESEKPRTEKPRGPGLSPWRLENPCFPSAAHQARPLLIEPQDTSCGCALQELSGHLMQRTGAALSQAGTGAALSQVEEAEGDGGPDGSRWRPGLRPGLRPGPATPWAGAEQTAAVAGPPACPRSLPHQPRPVLGPWPRVCLRLPAEGWDPR